MAFPTLVASLCTQAAALPPSGLSPVCEKAYETMMECRRKLLASDIPDSMKQMVSQEYAKQMADTVRTWRAMRGKKGIEEACREIAGNPECEDYPA